MTLASKITLARVALIPIYMLLMYVSRGEAGIVMWSALLVFIIASLTDFVDGHIARKYNQTSDFGKFLDPLADKLMVLSVLITLWIRGIIPGIAVCSQSCKRHNVDQKQNSHYQTNNSFHTHPNRCLNASVLHESYTP